MVTPSGPIRSDRLRVVDVGARRRDICRVTLSSAALVVTRDVTLYDDVAGFRVETDGAGCRPDGPERGAAGPGQRGQRPRRAAARVPRRRRLARARVDRPRRDGRRSPRRDVARDERRSQRHRPVAVAVGRRPAAACSSSRRPTTCRRCGCRLRGRRGHAGRSTTPATSSRSGPFEEQIHVENPRPARRPRARDRARAARARCRPVFVGFGRGRRRRGVAVPPVPHRRTASPATTTPSRSTRTARTRRRLPRRQGRHEPGDDRAGRAAGPPPRHRDVHPRRRLAGALRRLGARPGPVPRRPEPRQGAGDDRADEARAVDDAAALPSRTRRPSEAHPEWVCAPLGDALAVYNTARPVERFERGGHRPVEPRRACATSRTASASRSSSGACATSSSTSSPGSTALGQGDLYDQHDAFVAMLDRLAGVVPRT